MELLAQEQMAARRSDAPGLLALADVFLIGAERVTALTLASTRSAIADSLSGANSLLGSTDLGEAAAVQAAVVGSTLDCAFDYSRYLYEITAWTQDEMARVLESTLDGE